MAIDERRKPFKPTLWDNSIQPHQSMEQRWFAGVHTNIGGGYEKDGLANITLHWMLSHAINLGLEINSKYIKFFRPFYGHKLYDSMSFIYRLMGKNIRKVELSDTQTIDQSVKSRMNHDTNYKPSNIGESLSYAKSLRIREMSKEEE